MKAINTLRKNKIAQISALAFIVAVLGTFIAITQADHGPNVEISWISDNSENCHNPQNSSIIQNGVATWTAQITNHGPGSAFIEKAAFHHPVSGCTATDDILRQDIFNMSGKIDYAPGETGQTSFTYNTNSFNCGRVQVDAAYRSTDGSRHGEVFLGEIIDYGVDCVATPPPPPPPPPANQAPIGSFDAVTCDTIAGWAFDPDASSESIVVEIFINGPEGIGSKIFSGQTTGLRQDVNDQYGITGNHGFTITTPASIKNGQDHDIWVYAQDSTTHQNMLFDDRIIFNSTCPPPPPVLSATNGTQPCPPATAQPIVLNWTSTSGATSYTVKRSQTSGSGFGNIATSITGTTYSDTPPNPGAWFYKVVANLPFGTLDSNEVNASWIVASCPRLPTGHFDTANCEFIAGWAKDEDTPDQAVMVEIYGRFEIDQPHNATSLGELIVSGWADQFRSDVGNHAFNFITPGRLADGLIRHLYAYALDTTTGERTLLGGSPRVLNCPRANQPPTGSLLVADCNTISGQAWDPDTNAGILVHIYKDGPAGSGTLVTSVLANPRSNEGSSAVFSLATPAVFKDGNSHTVYAYAIDSSGFGPNVLLNGSPKTINCPVFTVPTCTPSAQTVDVQQNASFTASGGNGTYSWDATHGTPSSGTGSSFTTKFTSPGSFIVILTSGSQTTTCAVNVNSIAAGVIRIEKTVRNVSKNQDTFLKSIASDPGDLLEFRLDVIATVNTVSTVIVSDTLPNRLTYVSGSLKIDGADSGNSLSNISLGNINSGQTKSIVFRVNVAGSAQFDTESTTLTNSASLTSSVGSQSSTANVVVQKVIIGQNPFLTINKQVRSVTQNNSFADTVNSTPGQQVEFRIEIGVTNASANNVVVIDVLPNNFTLNSVSLDSGITQNQSSSASFSVGSLTQGTTKVLRLTATAASESSFPVGSSNWVNTATVGASNASSVSDTATVIITRSGSQNASLSVNKQVRNVTQSTSFATSTTARGNDRIQYRIEVRSTGNIAAQNVRLNDFLPANINFVSGTAQLDGSNYSGDINNVSLGTISVGSTRTLQFEATVANITTSTTLTNTVSAFADNASVVSASANVNISAVAGTSIELSKRVFNVSQGKDATSVVANAGDVIDYFFVVENKGSSPVSNYVIEDSIADVVQLADLIQFGGASLDASTKVLKFPAVTIPANGKIEKIFTVKVKNPIPSNTDYIMSNTFGNTVNVSVRRPTVAGTFIAPKTGSPIALSLILSLVSVIGFVFYQKKDELVLSMNRILKSEINK